MAFFFIFFFQIVITICCIFISSDNAPDGTANQGDVYENFGQETYANVNYAKQVRCIS